MVLKSNSCLCMCNSLVLKIRFMHCCMVHISFGPEGLCSSGSIPHNGEIDLLAIEVAGLCFMQCLLIECKLWTGHPLYF